MRLVYGSLWVALCSVCTGNSQPNATVTPLTLREIAAAQIAVHSAPDSEANLVSLASLYLRVGRNQNAIQTLQPFLKAHPDARKIQSLLAAADLRDEQYAAARDLAEQALRTGRDAALVEILAMAELGLQDTASAERLFQEALALNPDSAEADLQLGRLYVNQRKRLPEAISLLKKARTLAPNLAGIDATLGSAFLNSGDGQQAVAALESAIKTDPKNAGSYYLLASVYRQLHEEDKAQVALAAFNTHKKAEAEQRALEMRGRADYEEGVNLLANTDQLDKAQASFSKAIGELPAFDPAYYRLAQVSYLQGNIQGALQSIRQAIARNPFEPEYYFVMARCLQESDPDGAIESIQKAIGLRPGVQDFEDLLHELKAHPAAH